MRGKIIENVTMITKKVLPMIIKEGFKCIDATIGNGHDTQLLSELVGETGFVYGFDIQETALKETAQRLTTPENVQLICDGHQLMEQYVKEPIDFVIFNLGYLPKADKSITTLKKTTLEAVQAALRLLKKHGLLWIVVYPGHPEGREESQGLEHFVSELNQHAYSVLKNVFINQQNHPPYVIAIEKKID